MFPAHNACRTNINSNLKNIVMNSYFKSDVLVMTIQYYSTDYFSLEHDVCMNVRCYRDFQSISNIL